MGAKEEELAHLMEHFDNEEMFHKKLEEHKIKKATLKRPSGADQVVPSGSVVKDDPAKKKKILSPLEAIQLANAKKALPSPSNLSSSKTCTTMTTTTSSTTIEKLNNSLKPPGYMDGIAVQPNSEEKPVSFEEDAKIDTISTPTKGRVAPPRNRRPPTRKRQNDQDQEQVNSNNCDEGTNATAENNSEEITTMPTAMSSPGMMKKKKKLKKKGAPVGGVSVFGGTDLFGGKNPFANRKVDPSSSEEESMDIGSSTPGAASTEANKQQTELRLPFGEHGSTENKEKPKPPARKSSSSTKLNEKSQAALEPPKKKEAETKLTPEEKSLQELKNGVLRLNTWIQQKLAFAQDDNIFKGDTNIDAQISDFNVVEAELSAQVYAVKGLEKRGNDMINQGHPAVQEIQTSLASMTKAWTDLQTALYQKKQHLEEAIEIIPYMQQCKDFLLWIKEKTVILSSKEFHYDPQKTSLLKKKLGEIQKDMKKQNLQLSSIKKTADRLIKESHPQSKEVTAKLTKVSQSWDSLQALVKTKDSELSGASEVDILLQKLEQLMTKVKNNETQFVLNNTGNNLEEIKKLMKQQEENEKSITSIKDSLVINSNKI